MTSEKRKPSSSEPKRKRPCAVLLEGAEDSEGSKNVSAEIQSIARTS